MPPTPWIFYLLVEVPPVTIGDESDSRPMGYTFGMMLLLLVKLAAGSSELRMRATSGDSFSSRFVLLDFS